MALSAEERDRVRFHLGFPSVAPVSSIAFGIPKAGEALFLVESAMEHLLDVAEGRVKEILGFCDRTRAQMLEAQDRFAARSIDEVETNPEEMKMLVGNYDRWCDELANVLGIWRNRYDARTDGSSGGVNVSVRH